MRYDKAAAVVIAYADHAGLIFPGVLRSPAWKSFFQHVRQDQIKLATMSYQKLCELALETETSDLPVLAELSRWINGKIELTGNSRIKLLNQP